MADRHPTPTDLPAAPEQPRPWLGPRGLFNLIIWSMIARCVVSALRQLAPDEAYYWVWSRHLAASYFDHPPMVAYLIRLGTFVGGAKELGVRWPAAVMVTAMSILLAWTAQRLYGAAMASFVLIALLVCPLVAVLGSIMTPDTPACFFSAIALCVALLIFHNATPAHQVPRLWLMFGVSFGLALLSKYTSVLLGASVAIALLLHADGRKHLRTPWPWAAAALALIVFSPVVWWNAQHHWASFAFQLHHGLGDSTDSGFAATAGRFLEYVGGQLAVATPVLFVLGLFAAASIARRRAIAMPTLILLISTILPLLFFAYSSLHKRVEANWPAPAYLSMTLLIADYIHETFSPRRIVWMKVAIKVAAVATIFINLPELAWAIDSKLNVPKWNELFGWRELAVKVDLLAMDRPIFANDYQLASELSFYLPGQPDIRPLAGSDRPSAFDYFTPAPNFTSVQSLVFVRKPIKDAPAARDTRLLRQFEDVDLTIFTLPGRHGRIIRQALIMTASRPRPAAVHEASTRPVTSP